ncbi:MAG: ATP phosphoribosyltransferase regulatory subunit [Oscillospiraceae bacterium]|nr:ATP phosphoribosyltransferase regulatory subunit [Oscillospiraceae bacterium]
MQTSCERVAQSLRTLYSRYGYRHYKMSKFEEYDLYAKNKDFLVSDNVITFTDLGGKLMALKPDVTLSIVKNSKELPGVQKLYYNENVYRVTKGAHGFREIQQMGLECLGTVDSYCISEVLELAAQSLRSISDETILDISHLGLLAELMNSIGIPADQKGTLVKFISEKNIHELTALCQNAAISPENTALLRELVCTGGAPAQVLPKLESLLAGKVSPTTLAQFTDVIQSLADSDMAQMLRIDFSVVDDIHYYNGFVFKGFVNGLPGSVLSGGQYDKLMKKMKRTDKAIGFAVYMDMLERLEAPGEEWDVDVVLLYDNTTPLPSLRQQVNALTTAGNRVTVQQTIPTDLRYKEIKNLTKGEPTNA